MDWDRPGIDMHVHTRSPGCRYDPEEMAESIRLARRAGISRMVQLHNLVDAGGVEPTPADVRRSNDLGMRIVAEHPDTYLGLCYLNPSHPPTFLLEEIERCVAAGNLSGIKLWVSVSARSHLLDPIMERARELGVPVLHHAWYKTTGYVHQESTPEDIADLAGRHPRTTIVMAHLSGGGWRGVRDVRAHPNVLVDTSGGQPLAGLVEYAVAQLGAERVIYGSDWPIRDYATQRGRVLGADLARRDRDLVLAGNAARILGLEVPADA
ncbi:MAG TPA: amidohydrolase family protein [Candidatus Dormibacteraeota bacterium]|jgi:hypothetical protein|nr:amidohydrolase family protein [Candidatus Dormibacteraeota bacterium]